MNEGFSVSSFCRPDLLIRRRPLLDAAGAFLAAKKCEQTAYDDFRCCVDKLRKFDAVVDYAQVEAARLACSEAIAEKKTAEEILLAADDAALADLALLDSEVWVLAGESPS